jgi:hypothetical protein
MSRAYVKRIVLDHLNALNQPFIEGSKGHAIPDAYASKLDEILDEIIERIDDAVQLDHDDIYEVIHDMEDELTDVLDDEITELIKRSKHTSDIGLSSLAIYTFDKCYAPDYDLEQELEVHFKPLGLFPVMNDDGDVTFHVDLLSGRPSLPTEDDDTDNRNAVIILAVHRYWDYLEEERGWKDKKKRQKKEEEEEENTPPPPHN